MTDLREQKTRLRRQYRAIRGGVNKQQRQRLAPELNRHILAAGPVQQAGCVAGYLAFDGEPDLRFSLTQLHRRGVQVALPVLPNANDTKLQFANWSPSTPLKQNRHGISEPHGQAPVLIAQLDVALIPLVAFDQHGGRLGMGEGWYDRTFADCPEDLYRVGVAWSAQEGEDLPVDVWDLPLNAVVTEKGWFTFPG